MLAFGAPPFNAAISADCYFSYLLLKPGDTEFFKYHPHTHHLYKDGKIPQSFMDLLISMLMVNPEQRIQDVSQLLEFDILKNALEECTNLEETVREAVEDLFSESESMP